MFRNGFYADPGPDPGLNDQKLKENLIYIFLSKHVINLSPGLHKGHPSNRRSLQPSEENIQNLNFFFLTFFYFSILEPDPAD